VSVLPYVDTSGKIVDGTCFRLLPFCNKNCESGKCKAYYEKLNDADVGCYCCPYGLSSYVFASPMGKIVFTGIRIKGIYNKQKSKRIASHEYLFNPVIDENSCKSIAHDIAVSLQEKRSLESKLEAIRDLLHETRSLTAQTKNNIDQIWDANSNEEDISRDDLLTALKNAHVSSYMISNRFSYFDSVINPTLAIGDPYSAVVFRKFDKMRKLLRGYQRKNVWISISSPNQSNYRYNIYPTFETLLFIILENAIKYSPNNRAVDVSFDENAHLLHVTIRSVGPYCDENEIMHLCEKGFRGENAKLTKNIGQGFGLNFAKEICEAHGISLAFSCEYSHKDHGIHYGFFSVHLKFDNSLCVARE